MHKNVHWRSYAITNIDNLSLKVFLYKSDDVIKFKNFEFKILFYLSMQSYCTKIKPLTQKQQKLFNIYFFVILQGTDREFKILLIPTFTKSSIIFKLHCLEGWNHHRMSVTKFGSVKKKRRPGPFLLKDWVFYCLFYPCDPYL